jgi:hypothetical protein
MLFPHQEQREEFTGMAARQCGQGPRPGRRPVPPRDAGRVAWAAALQLAADFVRTRNRDALSASRTGATAWDWAGREGAVAGAGQERQSRTLPTPSSRGNDCIGSPHVGQRIPAELARPDSMRKPPRPTLACRGRGSNRTLVMGRQGPGLRSHTGRAAPGPYAVWLRGPPRRQTSLRIGTTLPTTFPALASENRPA